jgi:hypothetical protein
MGYTERHHIQPKCLGGTDDHKNLVRLTAREHFVVHHLLTKIHSGCSKSLMKAWHAFLHDVSRQWAN